MYNDLHCVPYARRHVLPTKSVALCLPFRLRNPQKLRNSAINFDGFNCHVTSKVLCALTTALTYQTNYSLPTTRQRCRMLRTPCRAQWLRGRTSDSRVTEPRFESCAAVLKPWACFFTLYCSSSLSCINEYLTVDIGGYVYEQPSRINCSIWLDDSQKSRDGV